MNVIDEYDRGEPQRDARRLTVRWKAEDRNVMTDDGPDEKALHVATFASPGVASHVTELHNRTLGDGQEPRSPGIPWMKGQSYAEESDPPTVRFPTAQEQFGRLVRGVRERGPARTVGPVRSACPNDTNGDGDCGRRMCPHCGQRDARPNPTAQIEQHVAHLIEQIVQFRLSELRYTVPHLVARIDGDPVMMANLLSKLGYTVFAPDHVFEVPPDWLLQINRMRENLAQDIAEQVPGAQEAADWFDRTQLDAEKPVDNVRRAFLAGWHAAGRHLVDDQRAALLADAQDRMNAVLADTDNLIRLLEQRGYQVGHRAEDRT